MFPRSLITVALLGAMTAAHARVDAQTDAQTPAQTPAPGAALTPAQTDAQSAAAMAAMTPAQKARLAPRRETGQVVGSPLPTVTDGYRPTLTPPTPPGVPNVTGTLPVRPAPAGGASSAPNAPLPVPVTNCSAGGCTGADGVRYNQGAAGVTIDPAGRTCHQVGTTVQCQ